MAIDERESEASMLKFLSEGGIRPEIRLPVALDRSPVILGASFTANVVCLSPEFGLHYDLAELPGDVECIRVRKMTDEHFVASLGGQAVCAAVFRANDGKCVRVVRYGGEVPPEYSRSAYGLAVIPDSVGEDVTFPKIVVGLGAGRSSVWDVETSKDLLDFENPPKYVYDVKVTPDSARAIFAGHSSAAEEKAAIQIYDVSRTKLVDKFDQADVVEMFHLSVQPEDPDTLYSVGTGQQRKALQVWDLRTSTRVRDQSLGDGPVSVLSVPDLYRVYCGMHESANIIGFDSRKIQAGVLCSFGKRGDEGGMVWELARLGERTFVAARDDSIGVAKWTEKGYSSPTLREALKEPSTVNHRYYGGVCTLGGRHDVACCRIDEDDEDWQGRLDVVTEISERNVLLDRSVRVGVEGETPLQFVCSSALLILII